MRHDIWYGQKCKARETAMEHVGAWRVSSNDELHFEAGWMVSHPLLDKG